MLATRVEDSATFLAECLAAAVAKVEVVVARVVSSRDGAPTSKPNLRLILPMP
jgi:hypothetical protein